MRVVLALLAAAAMVVGSLLLRDRLDDDDGSNDGGGGGALQLVCVTEVGPACRALAEDVDLELRVTVAEAGDTADSLVEGRADMDGWLTIAPWPAIVSEARSRAGAQPVLGRVRATGARSPLLLVAERERADVLAARCRERQLEWRCVGDVAGRPWEDLGGQATWGDVRPGHAPGDNSATGLAVIGQAVATFFGTTDLSSADFQDDAFQAWFARLERAVPSFSPRTGSLVEDMLLTPGTFDVVGALEAEARPLVARSSPGRRDRLAILYPAPVATADVVLALPARGESRRLAEAVTGTEGRRSLQATGWRLGSGGPPLPDGNGLPPAGVLDALRGVWREVIR